MAYQFKNSDLEEINKTIGASSGGGGGIPVGDFGFYSTTALVDGTTGVEVINNAIGSDIYFAVGKMGINTFNTDHNLSVANVLGNDASLDIVCDGDKFPRSYITRINGVAKTTSYWEFSMTSDGSVGYFWNGTNNVRVGSAFTMNKDLRSTFGNNLYATAKLSAVETLGGAYFHLSNVSGSSANGQVFRVDSDGFVGINLGAQFATDFLDVNGTARIRDVNDYATTL
jgi:hypothetical protein